LNALSITQCASKFSDAYRTGMGKEKKVDTFAALANTW
jgi:hypothetical protein